MSKQMKMYVPALLLHCLLTYCSSFIIPNELPSLLSIIYSNIPPVKVGVDSRFGYGFRLGPHADFQTLIELGPQTNTNPLSPNDTVSKRQSIPSRLQRLYALPTAAAPGKTDKTFPQKESKGKKSDKTLVGKIEFKKVPGIDDSAEKIKNLRNDKSDQGSPTKFVLL